MYKNSDQRRRVLEALRGSEGMTADDLAEELRLVPVTVRSHLAALRAQGLVDSRDERGRVGRPRRRFFLTSQGESTFPHRYAELVEDLLHGVRALIGRRGLEQVLDLAAGRNIAGCQQGAPAIGLEERLTNAIERLDAEGGEASWEKQGGRYLLRDRHCPYAAIAATGEDVCRYHLQVVTRLVGQPAHLEQSLARGDGCCVFAIPEQMSASPPSVRTLSDGRLGPERRPA